jgi:hypothetical protein
MAALRGDVVDRPPVSFWGHFYHRESTARDLVEATTEFQNEYGWDWIKLNPRKQYHVEEWGVRYRYPGGARQKPTMEAWPIHQAADWAAIGQPRGLRRAARRGSPASARDRRRSPDHRDRLHPVGGARRNGRGAG